MVDSSVPAQPEPDITSEPEPEPTPSQLKRIEIWRAEVAASSTSCACSAPTIRNRAARFGASYRKGVAKVGINHPSTRQGKHPLSPQQNPSSPQTAESSRRPHPPKSHPPKSYPPKNHPPKNHPPKTHPPETHPPETHLPGTHPPKTHPPKKHPPKNHPPDGPGNLCPVCNLPRNGVKYKWLTKREYGLMRARSPLPQPVSGGKGPGEDSKIKEKEKSVLQQVSQAFHRTKGPDSQPQSIEHIDVSKKTGTEMYSELRPWAADDGKHDETSNAMSGEDRRKRKTGVEGSAARPRRGRKLLFNELKSILDQ